MLKALITALCLALAGCTPAEPPTAAAPFAASVSIEADAPGYPGNLLILGSNVQWVDRGDEVLKPSGDGFAAPMLQRVEELSPTVLRYPGGSMSDTYHWKDGIGALSGRKRNEHFFSKSAQVVAMGTREFLELCEATGAVPLITVNVASGTPQEAAEWVAYTNGEPLRSSRSGLALPRVRHWEIGNEPYLRDERRKELWLEPEEYAKRASEFIRAMRKVDPQLVIGIPLRSDTLGGVPVTPMPGYNRKVLQQIDADFEFVALHNAYLPLGFDKSYSDKDLYLATAAAAPTVAEDLSQTRALLRELRPDKGIVLAITEYQALYTIGKNTDEYIATPAGALYVADLLRLLAETRDVAFANFWSLSGNWHFGALDQEGRPRPAYHVLKAFRTLLQGRMVPIKVDSPSFDSPRVGFAPARKGLPRVTAIATRDGNVVRAILINKDPVNPATTTIRTTGAARANGTYRSLGGPRPFSVRGLPADGVVRSGGLPAAPAEASLELPPHSVTLVVLDMAPS
jgi:alpha-N-arabinofuranosidase